MKFRILKFIEKMNFLKKPSLWRKVCLGVWDVTVVAAAVFVVSAIGVAAVFGYLYFVVSPPMSDLSPRALSQTSLLYDRTGEHILYQIYGEENRKVVSHSDIPDTVRFATVSAEDDAFYTHIGVDPKSALRALGINIRSDAIRQGGSTITMQLVKNVFLGNERTLTRKISEAVLAIKLERAYSKDEVLDWYLNSVPYGSNAYGIESAAAVFFGKSARDLTLSEAAILAALPKATTYYAPTSENRDELVERQRKIIARTHTLGFTTQQEMRAALSDDVLSRVRSRSDEIVAPHFIFYILKQLEKEYGRDLLARGGLRVITTLDYEMQAAAQKIVSDGAIGTLAALGAENAALTAVNPKTGEILAMVGSRGYFDSAIDGEVNVATRPRQPGSAFKPIAYAAAFEKGLRPDMRIVDAPTNFGPDGSGRDYIPGNYGGAFAGSVSLREALAQSLNIPAVKVLSLAGVDATIDLAHRLGITTLNERNRYGLSLVLGGGEITPLDAAASFSVFANDGVRNPTRAIRSIRLSGGELIESSTSSSPQRVLSADVARMINSILSDNAARTPVFGANSPLVVPTRTVAVKTGTTQEYRDAWTVGYTPSLSVSVWAGNNDNTPLRYGAAGVFAAAPLWNAFMQTQLSRLSDEKFLAYSGEDEVKKEKSQFVEKIVYYDKKTGKEISEKKAKKKSSDKVEKRVVRVYEGGVSSGAGSAEVMGSWTTRGETDHP